MARTHDMGGQAAGPIEQGQHPMADWEILADAMSQALGNKGIRRTDESRRAMEDLDPEEYRSLGYYERWSAGMETLAIEKGLLTKDEIDQRVAELEEAWGAP